MAFAARPFWRVWIACGMNMLHGTLIVEKDEIGKAMDAAAEHNGHQEFAHAVG